MERFGRTSLKYCSGTHPFLKLETEWKTRKTAAKNWWGACLAGSKFILERTAWWGHKDGEVSCCVAFETKQICFDQMGANESKSQELKSLGTQNGFGMRKDCNVWVLETNGFLNFKVHSRTDRRHFLVSSWAWFCLFCFLQPGVSHRVVLLHLKKALP